jgi:fructose-1,6-bisphosphatase/inositol monophosphatase family enzyme
MINLEAIGTIIRDVAAQEVLPRWQKLGAGDIMEKTGPKDLVTVADRACEKALTPLLQAALPGSVVVGEEGVEADPATLKYLEGDKPVWIIDPIDGTMAFSEGRREFDVMVALAQGNEIKAGFIYAALDNDLYMAQKGEGVMRSQKLATTGEITVTPLHAHKMGENISEFTGILGRAYFAPEDRAALEAKGSKFKKWVSTICAGHDYCRLARGEAQFAVYNKCMPWDHVPGLALLQEQGFKYARFDGTPYRMNDPQGGLLIAPRDKWDEIQGVLFGSKAAAA